MKKNKKQIITLSLVAMITLILLVIGATYAYFKATGSVGSSSDVKVTTATTDLLTFKVNNPINIQVTQEEFKKGSGNKSDSTKALATLRASNSQNIEKTTDRYNIYFVIENNDFEYTTSDAKPEILLNITDPNGNKVENITGLIHTENGFDITTRTGGFLLVPDYDIEATRGNTTTQEWNVEVTFVNLDTDQVKNMGKSLTGKLFVTKEKMSSYELAKIKNVEIATTYNSITTKLDVEEGTAQLTKYYYGIEKVTDTKNLSVPDVKFIETDKSSYTFSNLSDNSTYKVYSYATDKNGMKTNIYETEITTNEYNIPKVNTVTHSVTLNSITLSVNATKGDNDIVKYYYSKDNGATYEESETNSYVFSNLQDTTEYKIKVKVLDSYGRYSTEYSESIATETYTLPSITKVETTTKYNQISVTTDATKGSYDVAKYYYSIDGKDYVEGSTTYTFTGLTEKTTHTIKVKVVDTQGRTSNEYTLTATTDAYVLPSIKSVTTTSTSNSITINITGQNGDGTITKYYYSKDNGSNYVESTSNSYTFSDLTGNTTFYIKVYVKDSNGKISNVTTTSIATKIALSDYVKSLYTGNQGDNGIYHHDSSLTNGAGDNSYRYAGANPNNYVCFGSSESTCPTDNLYRIVGVFGDKIRLIKYDYATSALLGTDGDYYGSGTSNTSYYKGSLTTINTYYWNYKATNAATNTWSTSLLNKTNLNTNFITNIGTEWANKIAMTTWKVGGNAYANIASKIPSVVYQNEIVNPVTTNTTDNATEYTAKIGLMYASDYGFAADPSAWTTTLYDYDGSVNGSTIRSLNWMHMGHIEWTISRFADYSDNAFSVNYDGYVYGNIVNYNIGVRPSFNLESSVTYKSGTGTQSDPIRIN